MECRATADCSQRVSPHPGSLRQVVGRFRPNLMRTYVRGAARVRLASVRAYYEAGHTLAECKAHFGFSNGAWSAAVARGDVVPRGRSPGRRSHDTREAVRDLLEAGLSRAEIGRSLGISRPTVTYHAQRLGFESDSGPARRYDWVEIQR